LLRLSSEVCQEDAVDPPSALSAYSAYAQQGIRPLATASTSKGMRHRGNSSGEPVGGRHCSARVLEDRSERMSTRRGLLNLDPIPGLSLLVAPMQKHPAGGD